MTTAPFYQASPIKRTRATKAEVEARREALLDIIEAGRPMTVRQVFYQATVRGLVEKAESGYAKIQTDLTVMRRAGDLPYDWLADNTRWQRKPRTFSSAEDALRDTAAFYRKSLWNDADAYVEIWLEKDALAGVIYPITSMYDVPLMVARGYAQPIVPVQRGRVHQYPRGSDIHLPSRRLRSVRRQCRREDRGDPARVGAGCGHRLRTYRCHTGTGR
jgi:hypothetical protein